MGKVTGYTELTAGSSDDVLYIVDSGAGATPTSKKAKLETLLKAISSVGVAAVGTSGALFYVNSSKEPTWLPVPTSGALLTWSSASKIPAWSMPASGSMMIGSSVGTPTWLPAGSAGQKCVFDDGPSWQSDRWRRPPFSYISSGALIGNYSNSSVVSSLCALSFPAGYFGYGDNIRINYDTRIVNALATSQSCSIAVTMNSSVVLTMLPETVGISSLTVASADFMFNGFVASTGAGGVIVIRGQRSGGDYAGGSTVAFVAENSTTLSAGMDAAVTIALRVRCSTASASFTVSVRPTDVVVTDVTIA